MAVSGICGAGGGKTSLARTFGTGTVFPRLVRINDQDIRLVTAFYGHHA